MLAKVDIDANPGLAREYEIMSIPAVKGFRDGGVVAEFVGLQPAASIEAFFNRVIPSAVEKLVALGDEASLREAIVRDAGHTPARVALGRILLDDGRRDEAVEVLEPAAHDSPRRGSSHGPGSPMSTLPTSPPASRRSTAATAKPPSPICSTPCADPTASFATPSARRWSGIFGELGDQHPLTVRFRRRLSQALY